MRCFRFLSDLGEQGQPEKRGRKRPRWGSLAVATRIRFRVAPYDRHGRALSLGLFLRIVFALSYVVDSVHAAHNVVSEEEFPIGRDHHDLQLVR